jgi:hypothetical protein
VSGANFAAETLEWIGFAVAANSLPALVRWSIKEAFNKSSVAVSKRVSIAELSNKLLCIRIGLLFVLQVA